VRELAVSAAHARLGRFQIEAAIQSVHAERARTGRTDWAAIATFYDQLLLEAVTTDLVTISLKRST
jgi:RNA polymerase sigma-70 factor (ECF subfamily)